MNRGLFLMKAAVCCAALSWLGMQAGAEPLDPRVEKYSTNPNAEKVSVRLLKLADEQKAGLSPASAAKREGLVTQRGGVRAEVICNPLDSTVAAKLKVPGCDVLRVYPSFGRADVLLTDLSALDSLANLSEVVMVRPAGRAARRGAAINPAIGGLVNGRAVRAHRVDEVRASYGLYGMGQKIGILSDSFAATDGVRDADTQPAAGVPGMLTGAKNQDTGDLPQVVQILADFTGDEYGVPIDEGAAMGELVHDIAPAADIAFYTAFISEADFANGITQLSTVANCSVVVDDVYYYFEPVYQDGLIAQAAANCVARGVPYFSSAGNDSNRALRQKYVDIEPRRRDSARRRTGSDLHNWGSGNTWLPVTMPPGAVFLGILNWNQPWESLNARAGAKIDMDIYLTPTPDVAGLENPLSAGVEVQGSSRRGKGDALEYIYYENLGATPVTAFIAVESLKGTAVLPQSRTTPLEFSLMFYDLGSGETVIPVIVDGTSTYGGPTVFGHPTAAGVASVAAMPWWESPAFKPLFPPTNQMDPEYFTSRGGPLTVFFDGAGKLAPRTGLHPVITAVDGCDTTFFYTSDNIFTPGGRYWFIGGYEGEPDGWRNFFGTSAAAPNAAAVAALMKELGGVIRPSDLNAMLQMTAIDCTGERAAPGIDDVTGPGLIDAKAALDAVWSD